MGSAPSRETVELLLPQAPFYGQRQQVVLIPLVSHFFPDADCPLFRQLYDTRCDPSVRYYQCVKEIFTAAAADTHATEDKASTSGAGQHTGTVDDLVMECEPPECFPGTYFTREALYQAYIDNGPERFLYDTDVEMLSAYQADPLHAVRPIPCAVAFLYHLPARPAPATVSQPDNAGTEREVEATAEAAAAAAAAAAEPWLSEGCVEVLGCYVKITGFVGDVNLLNPAFTLRGEAAPTSDAAASAAAAAPPIPLSSREREGHGGEADHEGKETVPCMELHMYLTKSAGDHNRTHVLLSAMYTYAEQWQRACLHYAAIQEASEAATAAAQEKDEVEVETAATTTTTGAVPEIGVVPRRVRAHTTHVGSTAVFDVTRHYSSASSSYYRKFLESKSATVMRSLLSATEAARHSHKPLPAPSATEPEVVPSSTMTMTTTTTTTTAVAAEAAAVACEDSVPSKVTSHLSGTRRQRTAPETAFLLWAAPPLPAARLHSRRTNVPLLCFLREVRAAFMSMHVCAENLRQLQEIGEDSPLSDNIAVAPATLTCNCVEYEAALDDLVMWLETLPTEVPRHPAVDSHVPGSTTTTTATSDIAVAPPPTREETYLTVFAPSWVVQRLLEHVVDCLLHNLSPLEILKAQRELQHQHHIDPPPPTDDPATTPTPTPAAQKPVCHCALLKRLGKTCIHNADGPPCCCKSYNVDGTVTRIPCQCSVNHSIGLETKQLRLPDEDIIVDEWPPRLPGTDASKASLLSSSSPRAASTDTPDLCDLQSHRSNHRLLYLVGEDPAGRQSATQCLVNWLAQGHPLTVGSSNANVEELEITVTLPTATGAETEAPDGGETANKADRPEAHPAAAEAKAAALGCCDCGDCDCEDGDPMTAQGFTIHQLPRMAPLAPFLSTVAHPHPAAWSRRTLAIFREAAAAHERREREKAEREGGADRPETTPLLLLRPGTVIELSRAVAATAGTAPASDTSARAYREVRVSCFPTEELLLAELRFASRKGREGHPDDAHWVRYGPGEGPPPSVPVEEGAVAGTKSAGHDDDDDDDEDAVPPRPPGGADIVGDGSSCLWRMGLGDGADRILAVTPYFLKPTRKKHIKKKKAIPKAAAAHGTALNVFFYPLPTDTTMTTNESSAEGRAKSGAAPSVDSEAGAGDEERAVSTNGEAVALDADGNPLVAPEKAKKKKKKKSKKKGAATAATQEEEEEAGEDSTTAATDAPAEADGEPSAVAGAATPSLSPALAAAVAADQPTPTALLPTPSTPSAPSASTGVDGGETHGPSPPLPPAQASSASSASSASGAARAGTARDSQLNSAAPPFKSRQPSVDPEALTAMAAVAAAVPTSAAAEAGTARSTTATPAAASRVPLPRSLNAAAAAPPSPARGSHSNHTAGGVGGGAGGGYEDPYQAGWGYPPYAAAGGRPGLVDAHYYGADPSFMMAPPPPPPPPPPPGFMAPGPAGPEAGYYYGVAGAAAGPGLLFPPPPPPPLHGSLHMGAYHPGYAGPLPDPYYGTYDPRTGLPTPPPPPPPMSDGYGYSPYQAMPDHARPPLAAPSGRTITPPVPRTRRQVSFDPTGEPTTATDAATATATGTTLQSQATGTRPEAGPNIAAALLAEAAASLDAPPLLSHYNPAPMPGGLPPTGSATPYAGPGVGTLADGPEARAHSSHAYATTAGVAGAGASSGEIHVSVKTRQHHHHHTRTVSYLSESTTTDLAAGGSMLQFSTSRADLVDESPSGTNHSLPVQSPTSTTHRRHASFSHLTINSSEAAGGGAGLVGMHAGSAQHSGVYAGSPPHHHHHQSHHSISSNLSGRAGMALAGASSSGHGGTMASAAAHATGQAGVEVGSIKSGDTASTTNTAKKMQASSNTYRWDWRNVTLDLGEEDM